MDRFSLVMTRSITSDIVRACSADLGVAAAIVPNPLSTTPQTTAATLRIFFLLSKPSGIQFARAPEIHWLTIALCRLELDLLRRMHGGIVEPVTQTADDPVYLNAPVCQEYHVQNNVTFDLQTAPLRRILRTRLFQDVHRRRGAFAVRRSLLRRFSGYCLVREAAGLYGALLGARWRSRDAVAEARARHRTANSFIAPGSVAIAGTARQRGGARRFTFVA